MSLLDAVEQAIKSCKTEQTRINGSVQLYREILDTLTSQDFEESESSDDVAIGTDTSPVEEEELELLERALEKALHVRTGQRPSKKDPSKKSVPPKEPGISVVTSKDRMQTSAIKGNQSTTRLTSKSVRFGRKGHQKPGASVSSRLASKSAIYNPGPGKNTVNRDIVPNDPVSSTGILHHQAASKSHLSVSSGSLDPHRLHTSNVRPKRKANISGAWSPGESTACSDPSKNVLQTGESTARSLPQQNRKAAQTTQWNSLITKQNRLWDKVAATQRNPAPERSRFIERIRATFPKDWPRGSPDQTRALVYRLTHQGNDLTQRRETKESPTGQNSEAAALAGCEALERFQNFTCQVKQEWDTWDRWRPEGGCLCPSGANIMWGDGTIAPLPPTITYTTEAELRELENLRMRVALLQQEVHLEEALFDALSPQLSTIAPAPECPDVGVLRDVYSLLGEGGQHFPAIVQDSESD